ncbi:MAG: kelch repeat-containing protein [Chthoniobacteraceae bacterium]
MKDVNPLAAFSSIALWLAFLGTLSGAGGASAQTYTITDANAAGANPSFATGVNAAGQVSGYSTTGADAAQAWRFTSGAGTITLGSFGGADSRALGINDAGQVTGYSTDAAGLAHGFVFGDVNGLTDIGGNGTGAPIFAQHINASGQVAGFSSSAAGSEQGFRFTPPGFMVNLVTLPNAPAPATISAYGVNDAGRVVGVGTSVNGFNRAFRTDANGANPTDLGTLGGDESFAYAINNAGQVAGTSSSLSIDTHAFLFTDVTGMTDLGTLGGYVSTAFALNNPGSVVGTAQNAAGDMHAFAWTPTSGMRDLNDVIPVNSGWVLTEARGINDAGVIVGNGLLNGQPRAFSLTPNSGPDTTAPIAIVKANDINTLTQAAQIFTVTFWDDVSVSNATIASSLTSSAVRVTGPNGFNQLATYLSKTPVTADAMKITSQFYVFPPGGSGNFWNGASNGVYSISIEPNVVKDVAGNFMPGGVIGTFTVATELKPVVSIAPPLGGIIMAQVADFTLTALSSFPYAATDVFTFTIDWKNDGTDVQTITGTTGTVVSHTYTSTGAFGIKVNATDVHGIASDDTIYQAFVNNPAYPQASVAAPVLTGSRRLAVGLNTNGTLLCLGGLPVKGGKDIVNTLLPGATLFTDGARLSLPTIGLGAGIDSLNRVIVFGGIEPAASLPKKNGYVYTTGGGPGASIADKHTAVHDFAFTSDNLHRVYSIGGATLAGSAGATADVERYDGATNTWTVLASLPSPRISAAASYDGHGHILVFGGTDAAGVQTLTTFSYDIAANTWTQLADAPIGTVAGRVAQLGADNLIYVIGSASNTQVFVYDSLADSWFQGPSLSLTRATPACALGDDGFIYVMGGDNPGQGNNGLATVEKFDTSATITPRIVSYIYFYDSTLHVGTPFTYKAIAVGNPRPTFSLTTAPSGMTIDPVTGVVSWTPATQHIGNNLVTVRATSSAGIGEQTFTIPVTPVPIIGDITPPIPPASISLVHREATTVTLTWPAGSDDVGVVSYNVYGLIHRSGRGGGNFIGLLKSGITGRSFIAAGNALAYYVAAVDAAGNISARSPGVSSGVLTLPAISRTDFTQSTTVIVGDSFQMSLTAAANPTPTFTTLSGPAGMTLSRTSGQFPANDYAVVQWQPTAAQVGANTFTVFATNPNTSGGSATFTVTVLPNGFDNLPPTPVAQMTVSNLTADHATLTWTAAGDNIGVTNYHIVATHFGAPGEPNSVVTVDVPGTELTTTLAGLLPAAGYTTTITPSDAAGNVGPSTSIFFGTPSGTITPPSAVHTFAVSDISAPGGSPNFATGVNASGQVSGYATVGANGATAWRFTPGTGTANLPSFGGADSRALGINDAGKVTGYSTDATGLAHGFIFSTAGGLTDIGGATGGVSVFAQHINASGQVAGFASNGGVEQAFRFSPPSTTLNLTTIPNAPAPATISAYGMNDAGRVVGIGNSPSGFNRAFRTDADGSNVTELGTLGGEESWAFAINNAGQVVGTSASLSIDTHAFLFTDAAGMTDLGTLGGYVSTAFAIDTASNVVGTAETSSGAMHAFLWSATLGMRDLNEYVPVNSGWVLTEARGMNEAGVIVGNGTFNGQPRAFLLTPKSGADTAAPVAVAKAPNITSVNNGAQIFAVTFWDDVSLLNASIAQGAVRVTGPNGYSQLATFYNKTPGTDAIKVVANFYVTPSAAEPLATWTGGLNGTYSISVEPNVVRDSAGNYMPGGVIGTFTVTTETKPLASIAPAASPVTMAVPTTFTLTAQSSYPYAASDVFTFVIDWKNDGTDFQTVTGVSGTTVTHTFSSTGGFSIRLNATDPHSISTGDLSFPVSVVNPGSPQTWSAAPSLSDKRKLAVGLNSNGTLLAIGGTPSNGNRGPVDALAPGATQFALAAQLPTAPTGLGAGIDSLNRVIVFAGIEQNAMTPNTTGFVYTTTGGAGAAIAAKHFAVHDFAFATDNQHRIYSIGGATNAGMTPGIASVERYDAATNSWTTLAPLPEARVGATATYDGHGHIVVIGGTEPVSGFLTASVFSYDIATDTWSQLSNVPNGTTTGRVAALGADGLVYLIGGLNSSAVLVFDSVADSWYSAASLSTARNAPAVALGDDGFLYVMGGDYPAASNNAFDTVEKIDTGITIAPQIISSAPYSANVQVASTFSYKAIALGNPRPVLSLAAAPAGMTLDPVSGFITWTPAADQIGTTNVIVRATSSAGVGEQTFAIIVTPIPTDTIKPTAPASISLTSRTATTVTLTWPAGSDNVGVVSYSIYGLFHGSRSSHIGLMASGITSRSFILNGFATGYYVAAVDAAGNISNLSPIVGNAVLTLPVITRTNFSESTTVIVGNSLLLSLSASANPGPPTFSTFTGPAGLTVARTAGPDPLKDYAVVQWQPTAADVGVQTFTVSATNPNTTGGSATFTVTVLPNGTDTVPPTAVAQITASNVSFDHCTLTWTPAGDNIGVTNYHIVATHFAQPGVPNHIVTVDIPGDTLATPLTGLLAASIYNVSITPSDAAGNVGPTTSSLVFTTLTQPFVNFRTSPGVAHGTMSLDWQNAGPAWLFTVEYTDSLATPNWQPVAPVGQWPSAITHFVSTPDPAVPSRFFRVKATAAP